MKADIAIRNGTVVDPLTKRHEIANVFVREGQVVEANLSEQAEFEFDAAGMYVFPGLIDYHLHVFPGNTEIGIHADTSLLSQGVTTAVDAGSAGSANFEGFVDQVAKRSRMRIWAFLNVCPAGLATSRYHENVNPKYWDRTAIRRLFATYPNLLQGLKIRISRSIVHEQGMDVLAEAVKFAGEMNVRLAVHVTEPPGDMDEVAGMLRAGDILVHCFHGTGSTIIDSNRRVSSGVLQARSRGVVMDAANGRNHWSFEVAEAALKEGFQPDVISTDLTSKTLFRDPVFGLPYLMSKYLMLGMPLDDIVAACTTKPAALLGMEGVIGTLNVGAYGDIGVFEMKEQTVGFSDTFGKVRNGDRILVPKLTVSAGKIAFRSY